MATSELLFTNGTTPTTPVSGKSKLFVNVGKQLCEVNDAGVVTILDGFGAVLQSTPANPTGTTNTTGVAMGLGVLFTPIYTGRFFINVCGDVANNTAGDGARVQIFTGFSTPPINGAAPTSIQPSLGPAFSMTVGPANGKYPFNICGMMGQSLGIPPIGIGTTIWFDLVLTAITGGTANVFDLSFSIIEV